MTLGDILREARKKKGLTQEELAELVGVSTYTIGNYESDRFTPRISYLKWVAQALDLKIEELIKRI